MANIKITELNAAGSLAATDVVPVVDVSADETKKITATDLFRTLPDGTAAAPALAFSSDQANGVYLAGTDTVGISTGGTQRVTVDGSGNVTISGDLQVDGATTTVQSTTVTIDDKNIELGSVASPSNTTADGGGITLKGATDKTLKWINSTGCWTFNQPMNFNDHVRIDSSGRVGIGTSSPAHDLDISPSSGAAELKISGAEGQEASIRLFADQGDDAADIKRLLTDTSGNFKIQHYSGSAYVDSMVIDSSGRIEYKHNTYLTAKDSAGSGYVELLKANASNQTVIANNKNAGIVFVNTNTNELARIDSSGNVGIGTSSPTSYASSQTTLVIEDSANPAICWSDTGQTRDWWAIASGSALSFKYADGGGSGSPTNVTNVLQLDNSGNVGIGTTSPYSAAGYNSLTLNGSTGSQIRFRTGDTDKGLIYNTSSAFNIYSFSGVPLVFHAGASERMRIDSSGRLLVGLTSGSNKLHVKETNTNTIVGVVESSQSYAFLSLQASGTTAGAVRVGANGDDFVIRNATESVRVTSSGNVGIGVTSPAAKLDVAGNVKFANSSSNFQADFVANNSAILNFTTGTSEGVILRSDKYLRLDTGGSTERLRIDSSGRLLAGTSSSSVAARAIFQASSGGSGGGILILARGTSTPTNNQTLGELYFSDSGHTHSAEIVAKRDGGTWTSGSSQPTRLEFSTAANGASSPTERLRITSTGAWAIEGASNYGTSGQVLTSNGNDSPTWQDASGGGGATGGGSDQWVVETDQTVTTSYELGSGKHGTTVSPTINSGATITVPSGAILVIL